jgi:outer membrane protein insertion porin family
LWVKIPAVNRALPVLLLACAALLSAQARKSSPPASPSASSLVAIKATGSKRYASTDIVAATGLQVGQAVSEDDFKSISRHLGESGAFSAVAYTFESSPAGIKLELQVTDGGPFVPAHIDNFVWLSDQELAEKLRARVPLFKGELPASGDLADQVSEALQALAFEYKLPGRADYLRAGPPDGPVESFDYIITGENIRVRDVAFDGAGPSELPALQLAARKLPLDYSHSNLHLQAQKLLLPVYLERGYLEATVGDPQPKVVLDTPEETVVDVTFPIGPGRQYMLTGLQLSGYNVFPVEQLRALIHVPMGQPAKPIQIEKDVEAIKKLYGTRGYMAVQIHPKPTLNDADSTVKYLFDFNEGGIYKMGDLEIRGLDSRATGRLAEAWKLRAGDTYDSSYLNRFLDSLSDLLPGDLWNISFHESLEDKDRLVDVSLHFDLNGR